MRTWLDKTYEIVAGPAAPTWDTYQAVVMQAWNALLACDPSETEVQAYLEKHPGLLPGYRSMTITSGHTCFPPGVITQPPLAGLSKKIPDVDCHRERLDLSCADRNRETRKALV